MGLSLRRALFLDRDGVINVDHGYVFRPDQIVFLPGIFDLCRAARRGGYVIVVVTNQAGVARGLYQEEHVRVLHDWLIDRFAEERVDIAGFYYCPCHPEGVVEKYKCDSFDRKPNPGMLLKAANDLRLDLPSCILVGDKLSDILAAEKAGVGTKVLVGRQTEELSSAALCRSLTEVQALLFGNTKPD